MPEADAYASVEELAKLLSVDSSAREAELIRTLEAAAGEIDTEIGRTVRLLDDDDAAPWQLALAGQVNLDRAQDLWFMSAATGGFLGLGGESPVLVPRESWERHARILAPLKQSWGIS